MKQEILLFTLRSNKSFLNKIFKNGLLLNEVSLEEKKIK